MIRELILGSLSSGHDAILNVNAPGLKPKWLGYRMEATASNRKVGDQGQSSKPSHCGLLSLWGFSYSAPVTRRYLQFGNRSDVDTNNGLGLLGSKSHVATCL